jgi:acyl CoA:acetate/3-ketoacid CoA transferase
LARGQEVLYVTERAVFRLTQNGLELMELAPGIDLQTQVLQQMEFAPRVESYAEMSPECFVT